MPAAAAFAAASVFLGVWLESHLLFHSAIWIVVPAALLAAKAFNRRTLLIYTGTAVVLALLFRTGWDVFEALLFAASLLFIPLLKESTRRSEKDRAALNRTLQERERELRAFVESNTIGILFGDVYGAVFDCNEELARIIGRPRQEVLEGRVKWTEITPAEDLEADRKGVADAIEHGWCQPYEKHYIRPDGSRIPVVVGYTLLPPERERSIAFILDDSARKAVEQERRKAEEALQESNRRKDEFMALLGHELRNPLAAITSGINLLKRNAGDSREQWLKQVLDQQVKQLIRILDDLLDISRIARGKLQIKFERISAQDVVDRSVEAVRELMVQRRHQFVVNPPPREAYIEADPGRLEQILVNLLTNAAKYTPEGGLITLSVQVDGKHLVMSVKDNGIGIPPELQSRVFELFMQAEPSRARSPGGLGIGLGLVKALTEMHGGSSEVISAGTGRGSEFIIRLPVVAADESGLADRTAAVEESFDDRLRILVVEDNPQVSRMLSLLLEEQGHNVIVVDNGLTAVETAVQAKPDVVLLDIGLPGIDGYEVARRLRSHEFLKSTLIVATTAYGQERDRSNSQLAGINYHLVKPIRYEDLAPLLAKWKAVGPTNGSPKTGAPAESPA